MVGETCEMAKQILIESEVEVISVQSANAVVWESLIVPESEHFEAQSRQDQVHRKVFCTFNL